MRPVNVERPARNRVIAVFEASAFSFDLPPAATLEDLAGHLADLGRRDDGTLISVDVRMHS
jgi:hypothetical protein